MDDLVEKIAVALSITDERGLPKGVEMGVFYRRLAEDALSAIQEAHAIVPIEPTEAMVDRFVSRALCVSVEGEGGWSKYAQEQYKAMIEASPHFPTSNPSTSPTK